MDFIYPALFTEDDDGFVVSFPDVPEAITQGSTLAEALINAADALDEAICGYIDAGESLPSPGRTLANQHQIGVPLKTVLKHHLRIALRQAGISNVALANMLQVNEKEVRRMTDLDHNTKLERLQNALLVLGVQPAVKMVAA